jgi:hypothetical protein
MSVYQSSNVNDESMQYVDILTYGRKTYVIGRYCTTLAGCFCVLVCLTEVFRLHCVRCWTHRTGDVIDKAINRLLWLSIPLTKYRDHYFKC